MSGKVFMRRQNGKYICEIVRCMENTPGSLERRDWIEEGLRWPQGGGQGKSVLPLKIPVK